MKHPPTHVPWQWGIFSMIYTCLWIKQALSQQEDRQLCRDRLCKKKKIKIKFHSYQPTLFIFWPCYRKPTIFFFFLALYQRQITYLYLYTSILFSNSWQLWTNFMVGKKSCKTILLLWDVTLNCFMGVGRKWSRWALYTSTASSYNSSQS
jgi:hypothetical protein